MIRPPLFFHAVRGGDAELFLRLLQLPVSRFGLHEILDLLASPALAYGNGLETAEIDRLFDKACTEAAELISRAFTEALNLMTFRPDGMSKAASKKNRTVDGRIYTFLYSQLGLAARFLLSAIVDADRYNALFFEQNGNVEEPPRAIRSCSGPVPPAPAFISLALLQ